MPCRSFFIGVESASGGQMISSLLICGYLFLKCKLQGFDTAKQLTYKFIDTAIISSGRVNPYA